MGKYVLSRYNHYYQSGDNLKVMGGISRAIVEFEECSLENLLGRIEGLSSDERDYLKEYQIIVDSSINEYLTFLQEFKNKRELETELAITIGFTFACKFDCLYCIQKGNYQERVSLGLAQLESISRWVENALNSNQKIKKLKINYFGGEPTLNLDAVMIFSEKMSRLCHEKEIDLYQQMVTNGYALDDIKIDKLKAHGILDYQITLDGLAEIHNQRRSRSFDSFSIIVNNIIYMCEHGMSVFILHVFDTSNQNSATELVGYFNDLAKEHPLLKSNVTFNFVPTIPKRSNEVSCNKYVDGNEVLLSGLGADYFSLAKQNGFGIANFFDIGHCFRQARNTLLISPSLDIYKCYGTFGKKEFAIANLEECTFVEFIAKAESVSTKNGFCPKCENCDVVPFCRGGCQFSSSEVHDGSYGNPWCERDTIITSINGFLQNELLE